MVVVFCVFTDSPEVNGFFLFFYFTFPWPENIGQYGGRGGGSVMGSRVVGAVKSTIITFILLSGTHLRYNRS